MERKDENKKWTDKELKEIQEWLKSFDKPVEFTKEQIDKMNKCLNNELKNELTMARS